MKALFEIAFLLKALFQIALSITLFVKAFLLKALFQIALSVQLQNAVQKSVFTKSAISNSVFSFKIFFFQKTFFIWPPKTKTAQNRSPSLRSMD